jgi:SAM-dependent methyltransferase
MAGPGSPAPVGLETMSSAMPRAVNYHRWILSRIQPHARTPLLEAGCGAGQYTAALAGRVDRLVAVDIDPQLPARAADLPPNVELRVADLGDPRLPETLGRAAFSTVVCLNVLEHIPDDDGALRCFLELLRPGGALLLLVPAHPALYGRMDALAGHCRRYRRARLRRQLVDAGFAVRQLRHVNPLGGLGWWINARFAKPRTLSEGFVNRQILIFDRYVLPLSRLLDPLTAPFFGQSLWAVALRPGGDA